MEGVKPEADWVSAFAYREQTTDMGLEPKAASLRRRYAYPAPALARRGPPHHEQIATLPSADQLELIGDARIRRRELEKNLTRAERALEESWRTLTEEFGQQRTPEHPPDAEQLVRLWRERRD